MNDTQKKIKKDIEVPNYGQLMNIAVCKIGALKEIDQDDLTSAGYLGVKYILEEVYKDLETIQEGLNL